MPRRSLSLAFLCFVTVVTYASLRTSTFLYEDADGVAAFNYEPGTQSTWWQRSRPLVWLSYRVDSALGHQDPAVFHLTNVGLHVVNGLLVYSVAAALGAGPGVALLTAYLFLLHPLQTEAVAYISARTELLATLWILVAVRLGLSAWRWRAPGVVACLALALASKESAMIAPALLGLALWLRTPPAFTRRMYGGILGVGVLLSAAFLVHVWQTSYVPGLRSPFGWWHFWGWQATAVWRYLALVVYPAGQSVDHDFEIVSTGVQVLAGLTLFMAAGGVCLAWIGRSVFWTDRRGDLLAFGLVWALVDLAPRFVMRITEAINEHQMYRPMVGLSLALAQGLVWLYPSLLSFLSPRSPSWQLE